MGLWEQRWGRCPLSLCFPWSPLPLPATPWIPRWPGSPLRPAGTTSISQGGAPGPRPLSSPRFGTSPVDSALSGKAASAVARGPQVPGPCREEDTGSRSRQDSQPCRSGTQGTAALVPSHPPSSRAANRHLPRAVCPHPEDLAARGEPGGRSCVCPTTHLSPPTALPGTPCTAGGPPPAPRADLAAPTVASAPGAPGRGGPGSLTRLPGAGGRAQRRPRRCGRRGRLAACSLLRGLLAARPQPWARRQLQVCGRLPRPPCSGALAVRTWPQAAFPAPRLVSSMSAWKLCPQFPRTGCSALGSRTCAAPARRLRLPGPPSCPDGGPVGMRVPGTQSPAEMCLCSEALSPEAQPVATT